ncbi:MAG: Gfo/Idh/MocA family oxidoreductase [Planctomycetes bacterium]|nr:Gfo/Idh/MocA family oxidoreductase [Planctomycetota bacterium]
MSETQRMNRRSFLKETAAAAVAFSAVLPKESRAQATGGPPVVCGLIGAGAQGRVLLAELARMKDAKVAAVCDVYEPNLKKALEIAEGAKTYDDYRQMLDGEKDAQAVLIATPPHLHAEMCQAALKAGKHVLCEPPLALTVDDCKAIARAAKASDRILQVGYQRRYSPLYRHAITFVKTGVLGEPKMVRAVWHVNRSWRKVVKDPKNEPLLNWRLYKSTSGGLMAEHGSHQLDVIHWFLKATPLSVMGMGGIDRWQDGREVHDNVEALFQYPNGVKVVYSSMLSNGYEGNYELFLGTHGAVLLTAEKKGYLFKEPEAAALGWELYAKKEKLGDAEGIHIDVNASKLLKKGEEKGPRAELIDMTKSSFAYELEEFLACVREGKKPSCDADAGLRAAVACIGANEAIEKGTAVKFADGMFAL